jgi:hypothetical protein
VPGAPQDVAPRTPASRSRGVRMRLQLQHASRSRGREWPLLEAVEGWQSATRRMRRQALDENVGPLQPPPFSIRPLPQTLPARRLTTSSSIVSLARPPRKGMGPTQQCNERSPPQKGGVRRGMVRASGSAPRPEARTLCGSFHPFAVSPEHVGETMFTISGRQPPLPGRKPRSRPPVRPMR